MEPVLKNKAINQTLLLVTVIIMDLLSGAEFDLFVPSFPLLQRQFDLSPSWVEALLSVNFVGYCLSLFFVGGLSDRYGRKSMILAGTVIFIIGSAMCVFGPSYAFLLIGRFFQGVGVAAPSILSFLIIADLYSFKKQQYWIAMLSAAMNISVGLAPIAGSYLTLYFGWHGNFVVLLFLGLLVFFMTLLFVPTYQVPKSPEISFLRGYLSLLKSKPLMLLVVHIVAMCMPYWIFVGMSPILYMEDLGVNLSEFGYYQGVPALIFAFGNVLLAFMIKCCEQKKMLQINNYIFMISGIAIAWVTLTDSPNPFYITLALVVFVIGQIVPNVIIYPLALQVIPEAKGRVSALIQGSRLILTACALQAAGYYYQGSFQNIGLIILIFLPLTIWTLSMIIRNRKLLQFSQE